MMIHDMGDGLLVQLDRKDIINLHYSILELKLVKEATVKESYIKKWLIPFLAYLLHETGETT